eukprot:jgi/Botrbrau1/15822/Bobra.40_1s0008.1
MDVYVANIRPYSGLVTGPSRTNVWSRGFLQHRSKRVKRICHANSDWETGEQTLRRPVVPKAPPSFAPPPPPPPPALPPAPIPPPPPPGVGDRGGLGRRQQLVWGAAAGAFLICLLTAGPFPEVDDPPPGPARYVYPMREGYGTEPANIFVPRPSGGNPLVLHFERSTPAAIVFEDPSIRQTFILPLPFLITNEAREKLLPRLLKDPGWESNLVPVREWDSFLRDLEKKFPPEQMLPTGQNSWATWYFLAHKVVL